MSAIAQRGYRAFFDDREWFAASKASTNVFGLGDSSPDEAHEGQDRQRWGKALPGLLRGHRGRFSHEVVPKVVEIESNDILGRHTYYLSRANIGRAQRARFALDREFLELLSRWREETKLISSATMLVANRNYLRIIGMGPQVIPLVLQELNRNGGHWFVALEALTGENPVVDGDIGRVKRMAQAWIEWGRQRGMI